MTWSYSSRWWWHLFMESTFVQPEALSRRIGLITVITWNRYSFQMVGLNVISYLHPKPFLATHFANGWCFLLGRSICSFSIENHPLAFFHHWPHILIQGLLVGPRLALNYQFFREIAWSMWRCWFSSASGRGFKQIFAGHCWIGLSWRFLLL